MATALISTMRGHEAMLLPFLSGDGGKTHIARSADLGFAEITPTRRELAIESRTLASPQLS